MKEMGIREVRRRMTVEMLKNLEDDIIITADGEDTGFRLVRAAIPPSRRKGGTVKPPQPKWLDEKSNNPNAVMDRGYRVP